MTWRDPQVVEELAIFGADVAVGGEAKTPWPDPCKALGPYQRRAETVKGQSYTTLACNRIAGHGGNHQWARRKGPEAEWTPAGEPVHPPTGGVINK